MIGGSSCVTSQLHCLQQRRFLSVWLRALPLRIGECPTGQHRRRLQRRCLVGPASTWVAMAAAHATGRITHLGPSVMLIRLVPPLSPSTPPTAEDLTGAASAAANPTGPCRSGALILTGRGAATYQ